jgi:hypothetical protein
MPAAPAPRGSVALPSADLLQDLCSRFVLNCPAEELQSFERILFLVEQARVLLFVALIMLPTSHLCADWRALLLRRGKAHWFYEDFCRISGSGPALKSLSLREFAEFMFEQHPSLECHKVRATPARVRHTPAHGSPGVCALRHNWTASTSSSQHIRCSAVQFQRNAFPHSMPHTRCCAPRPPPRRLVSITCRCTAQYC